MDGEEGVQVRVGGHHSSIDPSLEPVDGGGGGAGAGGGVLPHTHSSTAHMSTEV